MIEHPTLFVCCDPRSERWQARLVTALEPCLFGWRVSPRDDEDASVPEPVKASFARALCAHGAVMFLCSDSHPAVGRVIEGRASVLDGIRSRLTGRSKEVRLVCSDDAPSVERAFDDPGFPWWMQGQALFLTDRCSDPELTLSRALSLVEPQASISISLLESLGIRALLLPGVDGAVAVLSCTSSPLRAQLLGSIAEAVEGELLQFRAVDEDAFAESLAARWSNTAQ
jgi:hypothetical protein